MPQLKTQNSQFKTRLGFRRVNNRGEEQRRRDDDGREERRDEPSGRASARRAGIPTSRTHSPGPSLGRTTRSAPGPSLARPSADPHPSRAGCAGVRPSRLPTSTRSAQSRFEIIAVPRQGVKLGKPHRWAGPRDFIPLPDNRLNGDEAMGRGREGKPLSPRQVTRPDPGPRTAVCRKNRGFAARRLVCLGSARIRRRFL